MMDVFCVPCKRSPQLAVSPICKLSTSIFFMASNLVSLVSVCKKCGVTRDNIYYLWCNLVRVILYNVIGLSRVCAKFRRKYKAPSKRNLNNCI